jgi:diadenosine tetraphosphate (Ap4A) HIT family hydrolase
MNEKREDCLLCQGRAADEALSRVQVWEDELWRLTVSLEAEVPGFAYLEPKRHIPTLVGLPGDEARTFGGVLARTSAILREVTAAEIVYVYVFGDHVPHLHVHLAPHTAGDALNSQMISGNLVSEQLAGGPTRIVSREFPPLPVEMLKQVAVKIAERLSTPDSA